MAKGNLFLGFGAGKVGDVVFYRANNEQMARARNRRPANPNSVKQRVQRAVLASVARLYSIGYEIFDHSFENEKVGVGSQRAFLRHNAPILRSLVVSDLNQGLSGLDCRGRVTAPRLAVAVPFEGMCISYGSYPQNLFQLTKSEDDYNQFVLPAVNEGETTVGQYARRVGLLDDDIYTFIVISVAGGRPDTVRYDINLPGESKVEKIIFQSEFSFLQLRVKPGTLSSTSPLASTSPLSLLFDFSGRYSENAAGLVMDEGIDWQILSPSSSYGVMGCIRSREDTGLRSESFAVELTTADYGLSSDNIDKAWGLEAGLSGSELILEGEEFQNG